MMDIKCGRCQGKNFIKNGSTKGRPKIKCKTCHFQTVLLSAEERKPPHFKSCPQWKRLLGIILYNVGLSLSATALVLQTGKTSVLRWIKNYSKQCAGKPEPASVVVMEIDEMWNYLKKSPPLSGSLTPP